jgi:hypothetical protein
MMTMMLMMPAPCVCRSKVFPKNIRSQLSLLLYRQADRLNKHNHRTGEADTDQVHNMG